MDLIPNIVSTVKWEANFEKSTLEAVVQARASATKTNINVADAKEMAEFQKEQTGISQALSRLLMVTENYPNLKANQAFADLRVSLEWTENRISTISINSSIIDNSELGFILDSEYNIITRTGLHCAPLAHKTIGTFPAGTLRFSFGYFNDEKDVSYILSSLNTIIKNL